MNRIYKINFYIKLLIIFFVEFGFLSTLESADKKNHHNSVTSSPLLVSVKNKVKTYDEVIVNGTGKTLKEAKKDASLNALTKVVGTYIKSEKSFQKKQELINKQFSKSKNFIEEFFEYRTGTIYDFELLESNLKSNIYFIKARVRIQKEDIKNYVKEYEAYQRKIKIDIQTISETNRETINTQKNLLSNLFEHRFVKTDINNIEIGKEQFLSNFDLFEYCNNNVFSSSDYCNVFKKTFNVELICRWTCDYSDKNSIKKDLLTKNFLSSMDKNNTLIIPIKISINTSTLSKIKDILIDKSDDHFVYDNKQNNPKLFNQSMVTFFENKLKDINYYEDKLIILNDYKNSKLLSFYFKNKFLKDNLYNYIMNYDLNDTREPNLKISISDYFGLEKYSKNFIDTVIDYRTVINILPVLNDIPISSNNINFRNLNSFNHYEFNNSQIVINSEINFLLLINLEKIEISNDDLIEVTYVK